MPGDELVDAPDAVMDRAFTLPAAPAQVWPWFNQLGKNRPPKALAARAYTCASASAASSTSGSLPAAAASPTF